MKKTNIHIAINGMGRIGRGIVRALTENQEAYGHVKLVALNDLADTKTIAHLLKRDSVHGAFQGSLSQENDGLTINGEPVRCYQERAPEKLPWRDAEIDVVLECTGFFTKRLEAERHLKAGAKKVLISAPAGRDADATIVYGVNHQTLRSTHTIVSNASCTTNCLAPLVKVLDQAVGIESGLMTTVHAYTSDQSLADRPHSDLRRARAAACSMIPTKTGAAAAVGLVLPHFSGKLDGLAVRVPTMNVSLVDFTFYAQTNTTTDAVNEAFAQAAEGSLRGILDYSEEPLVSIDYNHNPASSIVDAEQTRVMGRMVKVLAWYDNEWGFANRMLDTACAWMAV